jgi:hypothetical protein
LVATLEPSYKFVVHAELGNEEGVGFYILCCERPLFTLDVGVGLDLWDATYYAREVVVSRKYYQALGKKGLSYVMLNDNLVGYAYSHLVCYAKFLMPLVIHHVKGNTQVFALSKNTLEAIKGSLLDDFDVQNANQYEQLVEYVSNLEKHYGFPKNAEDFGSTDVLDDDFNEFESPSHLYMG